MSITSASPARLLNPWRVAGWGIVAVLLALPAVAMQFTDEVQWTGSDFIFAGVLLGGTGLAFEGATSLTRNPAYLAAAGIAILATLMMTWINMAVGIIGNEDHELNWLFVGVVGLEIVAAAIARLRAGPMAWAMATVALALAAIAAVVGALGHSTAILIALFAGAWAGSAALFAHAARRLAGSTGAT